MTQILSSAIFTGNENKVAENFESVPDHFNISISYTMINLWHSTADESYIIRKVWKQISALILTVSRCHAKLNYGSFSMKRKRLTNLSLLSKLSWVWHEFFTWSLQHTYILARIVLIHLFGRFVDIYHSFDKNIPKLSFSYHVLFCLEEYSV